MSGCSLLNTVLYSLYREIRNKYKQLARLMEAEQYEQFISSLKKEQQLTHRIRELLQYRKNGISKLEGESAKAEGNWW